MLRSETQAPPLRPHRLAARWDQDIPRHWLRNGQVATHLLNALGVMFPAGERFFVRTAKEALPGIADPTLVAQVNGFIAQETHHAHQHERSFETLERQGYGARKLGRSTNFIVQRCLEPVLPQVLRVSVTAALEHYTATLAEYAFSSPLFDEAHPSMRMLFLWHAAEEIEHKCVAYDVLQGVSPSYGTRLLGLLIATPLLMGVWFGVTLAFIAQEPFQGGRSLLRELGFLKYEEHFPARTLVRALREYVRRDFHPAQENNFFRAREFFQGRS